VFLFLIKESLFRAKVAERHILEVSNQTYVDDSYDAPQLRAAFYIIGQEASKSVTLMEERFALFEPASFRGNQLSEFHEIIALRPLVHEVHVSFHELFGSIFRFICDPKSVISGKVHSQIIVDFSIAYIDNIFCKESLSHDSDDNPDHLQYIQTILHDDSINPDRIAKLYISIFAHYLHWDHRVAWYEVYSDLFDRVTKSVEMGRQALKTSTPEEQFFYPPGPGTRYFQYIPIVENWFDVATKFLRKHHHGFDFWWLQEDLKDMREFRVFVKGEEELAAALGSERVAKIMTQTVRRTKELGKAGRREEIRQKDRQEMERIQEEIMRTEREARENRAKEEMRRRQEEEMRRKEEELKAKEEEEARRKRESKRREREFSERERQREKENQRRLQFKSEEPKSSLTNLEQLTTKARNVFGMPGLIQFLNWLFLTFPPVEPHRSKLENLIKLGSISRTDYRKILMIYHPDKNSQQEQTWRSSCEEISKVTAPKIYN
jgi:hypothetical protein